MKHLLIAFLCLCPLTIFAQLSPKQILEQRGELYFKFRAEPETLAKLSRIISIDNYRDGYCYAYSNSREFEEFSKFGIPCEPVYEYYLAKRDVVMAESLDDMFSWNCYPTYDIYEEMMLHYAQTYPEICRLDTIGTTFSDYKLLVLKISDNAHSDEAEPEVFLGGQIHGDELIGGMLCLKIIDKLLREYETNSEVSNLVNNLEIYINPLSNPQGTYALSRNDVSNSIRYTYNGMDFIDINRNFPDPEYGEHPDENIYSIETQLFMQFADEHNFVMSANIHSGAEVVNYPFDCVERLPADDDWWRFVSAEYVENVRNASNNTYFDGAGFENAYINGYAWYQITGSRQDYMNYFKNCREVTLELGNEKRLSTDVLPSHLNYNEQAILSYFKQATYGLRGFVTDSISGEPLEATIFIHNHDYFNSQVYSFLPTGEYYRYLKSGTYDVSYLADGYITKTITVNIIDEEQTNLDVRLVRSNDVRSDNEEANCPTLYPNPVSDILYLGNGEYYEFIEIFDMSGKCLVKQNSISGFIDVSVLKSGAYFVMLKSGEKTTCRKFVKM